MGISPEDTGFGIRKRNTPSRHKKVIKKPQPLRKYLNDEELDVLTMKRLAAEGAITTTVSESQPAKSQSKSVSFATNLETFPKNDSTNESQKSSAAPSFGFNLSENNSAPSFNFTGSQATTSDAKPNFGVVSSSTMDIKDKSIGTSNSFVPAKNMEIKFGDKSNPNLAMKPLDAEQKTSESSVKEPLFTSTFSGLANKEIPAKEISPTLEKPKTSTLDVRTTPSFGGGFTASPIPAQSSEIKSGTTQAFSFGMPLPAEKSTAPIGQSATSSQTHPFEQKLSLGFDAASKGSSQTSSNLFGSLSTQKTLPIDTNKSAENSSFGSFGSSSQVVQPDQSAAPKTEGTSLVSTNTTSSGLPPSKPNFGIPPTSITTPLFGATPKPVATASATTMFGNSSSGSNAQTSSTPMFGASTPSNMTISTPLFGAPAAGSSTMNSTSTTFASSTPQSNLGQPTSGATSAPLFGTSNPVPASTFGSTTTPATSTFGTPSAPATSTFGKSSAPATSTFGTSSAPATSFGMSNAAPTNSLFGASNPTPNGFGVTSQISQSPAQPIGTNSFGSTSAAAPLGNVFGTSASFAQPSQISTGFGAGSLGSNNNNPGAADSNWKAPESSTSTPWSASSTTDAAKPTLQFGNTTSAATPTFGGWGSTAAPSMPSASNSNTTSGFTFGAPTEKTFNTPSIMSQPSQPSTPAFGQPSSSFNFGASTPGAPPVFGSTPTFGASTQPPVFGGQAPNVPNFGAPAGRAVIVPKSKRGGPRGKR